MDSLFIRLICSKLTRSELGRCMQVSRQWKDQINNLHFYPLFLEAHGVELKYGVTAEEAFKSLKCAPNIIGEKEREATRIFLEIFMLFGGRYSLDDSNAIPSYKITSSYNDREYILTVEYKHPPCCDEGWYTTEYYSDSAEEKLIFPINQNELNRLTQKGEIEIFREINEANYSVREAEEQIPSAVNETSQPKAISPK